MNLFKILLGVGAIALWFYLTCYTPKCVTDAWRSLVKIMSQFSFSKLFDLLLKLILLILNGLLKLFDILTKITYFIFYNVPISLSFIFILPCLLLGLVLIFKFHEIFLGLTSLICAYVLIKINKDMQGGK